MKTVSFEEFKELLDLQGAFAREELCFVCPMCGVVQDARDLIVAGAGESFEDVALYLGFSCVGRWTGAGAPRKEHDGNPCNWSLGGLLKLHDFEVVDDEGTHHPHFRPATKDECLKKEVVINA